MEWRIGPAGVLDAIVWDGAPGHRDGRVGRIGVPLIPLPAYSPELNPAERLFEAIRAEIEGEAYADLDATRARVEAILARWDTQPDQVRSLVGWLAVDPRRARTIAWLNYAIIEPNGYHSS